MGQYIGGGDIVILARVIFIINFLLFIYILFEISSDKAYIKILEINKKDIKSIQKVKKYLMINVILSILNILITFNILNEFYIYIFISSMIQILFVRLIYNERVQ